MKKVFLILFVLISSFSFAYDWDNIGPADVNVLNFYFDEDFTEILCTDNGFLINTANEWIFYSYNGLPVWEIMALDSETLLMIIGNGSWSDGIYTFNVNSQEFNVVEWMVYPHFLIFCETNSTFYGGHQYGLWESFNGLNWTEVGYFNQKDCVAMAYYENHLVISADSEIHYSPDSGVSWDLVQAGSPIISDLEFDDVGTLFGIFPGISYSSGLWSSNDFGDTWNVEFWEMYLTSVGLDVADNIFVGWENEGIAMWLPDTQELNYFNDGLSCLNVNKLTYHPGLDCLNIVCCTQNGAHLLTNYEEINTDDEPLSVSNYQLSNFPNPFNPSTTISFSISRKDAKDAETCPPWRIEIYNIKGQKVKTFPNLQINKSSNQQITWDGTDENNKPVSSGIYFYKLKAGEFEETKKMILIK